MALLPMLFSNWWEDLDRPHHVLGQDFGMGISPENLQVYGMLLPKNKKQTSRYYRPWGEVMRQGESGSSTVKAEKDKFQVVLDVQQFAPEEINVKVVDRFVIVEGKHEEKQDEHGWISRQFSRKYMIPEQCDIDQVASKLSSDGVLSITVPRKPKDAVEGERVINIEHTGKPAIRESAEAKKENKMDTN
ncbi:protein lethal(2)essential for life-like [Prorops nasuta]|uniref:protein lethal(2)essential for life-like n=1 Tax=Prorops nasuta TaxID=863751 RepID=UPI0034CE1B20